MLLSLYGTEPAAHRLPAPAPTPLTDTHICPQPFPDAGIIQEDSLNELVIRLEGGGGGAGMPGAEADRARAPGERFVNGADRAPGSKASR